MEDYHCLLYAFDIEFVKVRGHSDNKMNNLADKLVNEAMDNFENSRK